jgi:hypothetical protein
MYTDIHVQELTIPHIEHERAKDAMQQDMIRLARNGQPALPGRILDAIGLMLIAVGEFLRRDTPTIDHQRSIRTGTPGHRGLEQRTLSHSKT